MQTVDEIMGNLLSTQYPSILTNVVLALNSLFTEWEETNAHNGNTRQRLLGNQHCNRGYAIRTMESLSEDEFHRMFRMTRFAFSDLLSI